MRAFALATAVGEGGQTETGVISVKAGHNVNPGMVRDLGRVMQRDGHRRPKLPPLVSPNRKAPRVETRTSHQQGSQGELL